MTNITRSCAVTKTPDAKTVLSCWGGAFLLACTLPTKKVRPSALIYGILRTPTH